MKELSKMTLFRIALLLSAVALAAPARAEDPPARGGKMRVYIGTYTGAKSKGIYVLELDLATGALSAPVLAAQTANPSFLAIHPSRRFLYAVGELDNFKGKKGGAVTAFAIDAKTGKLTQLNQQSSGGAGPCHLVVDAKGKNVLVANYGGGSVAVLPIDADGKVREASSFIQHKGSSVDKGRQEGPHGHSINLDAANRFAVAADLGLDKVLVYKFDADKGTLTPNTPPSASVAPGSGPRHFAFQPNGRHAYVINEMKSTVTAFDYDAEKGVLKPIQTLSTLPRPVKGNSTAEVQVHPSGKFVYGSNRGHNSIAIFTVDSKTGQLTAAGHQATGGKTPRNFGIDPTGKWLLAANQDSDTITVFRIDAKTGKLEPTEHKAEVGKPVCVKMIPVRP
jgi:6-phosphogluconolactonase